VGTVTVVDVEFACVVEFDTCDVVLTVDVEFVTDEKELVVVEFTGPV